MKTRSSASKTLLRLSETNISIVGQLLRVARLDAEKFHFLSDPTGAIDALRSSSERVDLFTFLQAPPERAPQFPYHHEWDNLAVLPISTFEQWWTVQINGKTRNKARQANKKGMIIREVGFDESFARGVWEIYNETPIRQGRRFPHYGKSLETVFDEAATYLDCSAFVGAYIGEQLVGFVKLVVDFTGQEAGIMHILAKVEHRDKAPTNALIAEAVRICAQRGIGQLIYSNFAYGSKQRDSLSDFKEHNGFMRVDVPRYYVPLTSRGTLALQFGLHRPWKDYVPNNCAGALRKLRSFWNEYAQARPPDQTDVVSGDARNA